MNDEEKNIKHIEIPVEVVRDNSISSTSKVLMGLITTLSMKDGYCYASNKYLGNILNVSIRTITSCLSSLKKRGFIYIRDIYNKRRIYVAKNY